jgi:superfamily I DNA/RNA helicase
VLKEGRGDAEDEEDSKARRVEIADWFAGQQMRTVLRAEMIVATGATDEELGIGGAGAQTFQSLLQKPERQLADCQLVPTRPLEEHAGFGLLRACLDGAALLAASQADAAAEEEEAADRASGAAPQGRVQLMTIFRAKGLEWDVVVMLGTCDQDFFGSMSGDSDGAGDAGGASAGQGSEGAADATLKRVREDARLAYVAMTRARDLLIVSSSQAGYHKYGPRQVAREVHKSVRNACKALGVETSLLGFGESVSPYTGARVRFEYHACRHGTPVLWLGHGPRVDALGRHGQCRC